MKYYRKSRAAAHQIISAFQSGNVPQPLAQVFVSRQYNLPMATWSFSNQFLCAIAGCSDARGYRQWQEVGRQVLKGEHARANILVPLTRKIVDAEEDEEAVIIYGFTSAPVFDVSQTDGDPLPDGRDIIDDLPYIQVAKTWGIDVTLYAGQVGRPLGRFAFSGNQAQTIALGVENLSTWAHELIHAADHRLGNLQGSDPQWQVETIAELGGATLLTMIGEAEAADIGGAWDYIQRYAKAHDIEPITACARTLDRIGRCIELIIQTAIGFYPIEGGLS